MKLDNYIFLCSSNGDMYLQNIKKETLISAKNQVSEDAPSTIVSVEFYSSTDCQWNDFIRKSICDYWGRGREYPSIHALFDCCNMVAVAYCQNRLFSSSSGCELSGLSNHLLCRVLHDPSVRLHIARKRNRSEFPKLSQ